MSPLARFALPIAFALAVDMGFAQDPAPAPATEQTKTDEQSPAQPTKESFFASLGWTIGPKQVDISSLAKLDLPATYRFLGGDDTRKLLSAMQNIPSKREVGFVSPDDINQWFAVFEFDDTGYVKDDEKGSLDADAILSSLKEGNDAANEERKSRGWTTIDIVGWQIKPHYDEATHNLEWATKAKGSDGSTSINVNTRILGRKGVMRVTLVCDPEKLDASLVDFKKTLGGFDYQTGERYAEYKAGDKLAEYGLTALVAGGAGVVALKTGLLAKFWKLIVAGVVAVGAFFKKLFGGGKSSNAAEAKN